jgi:hypothetical protein
VQFYNQCGTAEQWIKEGKQAVKMTRLSCHRFRSNEVRLWLGGMVYNLGVGRTGPFLGRQSRSGWKDIKEKGSNRGGWRYNKWGARSQNENPGLKR